MDKKTLLNSVIVVDNVLTRLVTDEEIFHEIIQRGVEIRAVCDPAKTGDFVRCRVGREQGELFETQLCIGNGIEGELEDALRGMECGGEKSGVLRGDGAKIEVLSVKRRFQTPLDDGAVRALALPGVKTMDDYRRYFLAQNEAGFREAILKKIQPAVIAQLIKNAQPYYEIDEAEAREGFEQRKLLLLNYVGGDEARYFDFMRTIYGKKEDATPAFCEEEMLRECRRLCAQAAVAALIAQADGLEIGDKQYEDYIAGVCSASGAAPGEAKAATPFAKFKAGCQTQHMLGCINDHFRPRTVVKLARSAL